ncbi:hypothetical protein Droror1_Dr00023365 [Drosera rotundifolia]
MEAQFRRSRSSSIPSKNPTVKVVSPVASKPNSIPSNNTQNRDQKPFNHNKCYKCHEKWNLGHKCHQVHMMEAVEEEEEEEQNLSQGIKGQQEEEVLNDSDAIEVKTQEEHSIHALLSLSSLNTIRIKGRAGKVALEILIDSGSTHSFVDVTMAEKCDCVIKQTPPLLVSVADGAKVESKAICPSFRWNMHGITFTAPIRLLTLGSCDMVLGTDWLRTCGPVTFDFEDLKISFVRNGKKLELQGVRAASNKEMGRKSKATSTATTALLCQLNSMETVSQQPLFPEFQTLLDAYEDSNKNAGEWKNKPILHYDKFVELYGQDRVTGEHAETAAEIRARRTTTDVSSEDDPFNTIDNIDQMVSENEIRLENFDDFRNDNKQTASYDMRSETGPPKKKKKSKISKDEDQLGIMKENLDNVAQAILDSAIELLKDTCLLISEHEVWNLLNELGVEDGIDEAYVFLVRNLKELQALLVCPFEVRKRMLVVMMRA